MAIGLMMLWVFMLGSATMTGLVYLVLREAGEWKLFQEELVSEPEAIEVALAA
jgi:hypothetical protein